MADSKRIPMVDLAPEHEELRAELLEAIRGVLASNRFVLGPNVEAFEQEVARYLGVPHAVGVNSGTDALILALEGLGVGAGDEVITSPFTFFGTAEAISRVGATPVFADIEPSTFNLDPLDAEKRITPQTRAILVVHLFGHAADLDAFTSLSEARGISLVEDVAQAFGGEYGGRKLGSFGHVSAFSFYPPKNLGAIGDGGLLATRDAKVLERARMLRDHGATGRYHHEEVGYNSRLDEIQAAVLRVKLPHLDRWNEARREIARRYTSGLQDIDDLATPSERPPARHVYQQYTLRIGGGRRDAVQERLGEAGVSAAIHYPTPVPRLPVYGSTSPLPEAERAASEVLSLPMWPMLGDEVLERVVSSLKSALAR
ncbi:MAG: DegT/DnrJ/EryC1/StrS family aminotransferase [Myxococcota bacterium]